MELICLSGIGEICQDGENRLGAGEARKARRGEPGQGTSRDSNIWWGRITARCERQTTTCKA